MSQSKLVPLAVPVLLVVHPSHGSHQALQPLAALRPDTHPPHKAATHAPARDYTMEAAFPSVVFFQMLQEPSNEPRAGTLPCTLGDLSAGIEAT